MLARWHRALDRWPSRISACKSSGRRLRSAGRAAPGVEVRVVDDQDINVANGEVGEVLLRARGVMLGYWKQPEASAEALRGGWMHTGDMGILDADGYLTIVDRKKDMIISGGENVYSTEVESVWASRERMWWMLYRLAE